MKAFIKADAAENPQALNKLINQLSSNGVNPHITERHWKDISYPGPFLYYRNVYIRFERFVEIATFHAENPDFPYLLSSDGEVVSVNNCAKGNCAFSLNAKSIYIEPDIDPLPILIGLYKRPLYAELALNSLAHSLRSAKQKLYIVLSQPDEQMLSVVNSFLKKSPIYTEVVRCENNLAYAFANFGSKYFNLPRFIHFEEDGILPENIDYHVPYWTNQLNYRSETAGFLSFKVSDQNYTSEFYKSEMYYRGDITQIPKSELWYYTEPPKLGRILPIGGVGCVIDSSRMYKNFTAPEYCTTDHNIIHAADRICILNVPIYHIGANQEMDYPEYFRSKRVYKPFNLNRMQTGIDLITGATKVVDLQEDWHESIY